MPIASERKLQSNDRSPSRSTNNKGPFGIDVLKILSGTVFAQALGILTMPLITRLYGPEAFGLQAIFSSVASILAIIVCLSYEMTILLPKDDEEAANLLSLCILIAAIMSSCAVPLIWICHEIFPNLLNTSNIDPYLWLLPPSMFVSGVSIALSYWNTRTRHFMRLSMATALSTFTSTGTKLVVGFMGYAVGGGLIVANLMGAIASTLMIGCMIWRDNGHFLKENISLDSMFYGFQRYKRFPQLDAPSSLINTISWQLPILLLSAFFSSTVVGFYSLGFMIIQLPMSLIGDSISRVFFQRASEAKNQNTLGTTVESIMIMLIQIAVFPMLLLSVTGKDIFIVFFGSNWAEAGVYAQILSIWAIFWFISSPLSTIVPVLEKLEYGLMLSIANLITRFLAILIGGLMNNVYLALLLFSLSGILVYGLLSILIMRWSGVDRANIFRIFAYNVALFAPACMILLFAKALGASIVIELSITFIILIAYLLYLSRQPYFRMLNARS